jgi:hypothetical protein
VHAHGGVGYEVDFLSNLFLSVPEFRRALDSSTGWQRGMNQAGLDTGTPIQVLTGPMVLAVVIVLIDRR